MEGSEAVDSDGAVDSDAVKDLNAGRDSAKVLAAVLLVDSAPVCSLPLVSGGTILFGDPTVIRTIPMAAMAMVVAMTIPL